MGGGAYRLWTTAAAISLSIHLLVLWGLLEHKRPPRQEARVIELSLEPLTRITPKEPRAQEPTPPPANRRAASRLALDQASAAPLTARPPVGSAAPAGSAQPALAPAKPEQLVLDCLDRGASVRTGILGREDCEPRRFSSSEPKELPGQAPANSVWTAAVKAKAAKREPLPAETDDILWDLVKRRF